MRARTVTDARWARRSVRPRWRAVLHVAVQLLAAADAIAAARLDTYRLAVLAPKVGARFREAWRRARRTRPVRRTVPPTNVVILSRSRDDHWSA